MGPDSRHYFFGVVALSLSFSLGGFTRTTPSCSIRLNMSAWDELGIVVKPHFATPYPGSEWFTVYRDSIEAQYGGDLETYVLDLGDASAISAIISHNFNAVELIGLRDMMLNRDMRRIDEYEKIWRRNHAIPDGAPSTVFKEPQFNAAAE